MSLDEFRSTYDKFLKLYGECSRLITDGIELETKTESDVSQSQAK